MFSHIFSCVFHVSESRLLLLVTFVFAYYSSFAYTMFFYLYIICYIRFCSSSRLAFASSSPASAAFWK